MARMTDGLKTDRAARRATPALLALQACIAAVVSIVLQGFEFGVNNNVFHVPIVLRMYDLAQFAHDPVIQSLRNYVSPVFPLLALISTEGNIAAVFFACHLVTRVVTFYALITIMIASGLAPRRRSAATMVLVFSGIYGMSPIGQDGVLLQYYTHTETSQAVALFGIALLLRRRLVAAAFVAAIAFDLNAFVGVWMVAPLGLASILALKGPTRKVGEVARAAGVFLIVALPLLIWIRSAIHHPPPNFDFPAYLRFYFPRHFFLDAAPASGIVQIIGVTLTGFLAAQFLKDGATLPLFGLLIVFALGIFVGVAVHTSLVFELFPLRVDGMIVTVSAAFAVSAAMRLWDPARVGRSASSAAIVFGLVIGNWYLPVVALLLLLASEGGLGKAHAQRIASWSARSSLLSSLREGLAARLLAVGARPMPYAVAASALLLAYGSADAYLARPRLADGALPRIEDEALLEGVWPKAPQWREVQLWAKHSTAKEATFLVPLRPLGFRVNAERVIWVDAKEGAHVLWAPELYDTWYSRLLEVSKLRGVRDRLDYACAHDLSYVVIDKRSLPKGPETAPTPVFENALYTVYPVGDCP